MKRNYLLEKLAAKAGNIRWIKAILNPFWKAFYLNPRKKTHAEAFLSNALDLLKRFDQVFKEYDLQYCLVFGTLLGAIREHGFIKHDMDIDVAVWSDANHLFIEKILTNAGFRLERRIEVDNGVFGREETYTYKDVNIDLFYFYPYDEKLKYTLVFVPAEGCKDFKESVKQTSGLLPLQLMLPLEREIKYVPFENINVPVPVNALEFIEARYGKNWRIPDPTFVYPKMGEVLFAYRYDKKGIMTGVPL